MRPLHVTAAATLSVASLLPLATGANAAVAAAGTATSTATLASVTAVGTTAKIAQLTASAGNTAGTLAKVVLAPLAVNGSNVVPAITVEPSSSPVTVPGATTPAGLASVVAVTSPSLQLSAAGGESPTSGVTTPDGLGAISVLGLPVALDGTLSVGSLVSKTKADAAKTLTITDLSLPTLADLLDALSIDLAALPADVLNDLLGLPVDIEAALQTAIDDVNDDIDGAQTAVDDAVTDIEAAQGNLNIAQGLAAAVTSAQTAFSAALTAAGLTPTEWTALGETLQQTTHPTINALEADLASKTTASAANTVASAQAALDTAQGALDDALDTLLGLIGDLADLVQDALDTPLVSLASAQVGTLARVDSGKTASVVGSVSGLKILDLDVLDEVTGNSTLDLAGLADTVVNQVNSAAQGVMNQISSILAGATGMIVPAPQVKILQKVTKTGTSGAFGTAEAAVSVLSISMKPITLPEDFASLIPSDLPVNVEEIAEGVYEASGFDVSVGTLSEAASYRPAALGTTPPTGAPLPATGAPYGLALMAATALGAGVLTRRKLAVSRAEA